MLRARVWAERVRGTARSDVGSAPVEFITVGLLLLVPLVYLVIALGALQSGALGVESGARHIARTMALSSDGADAAARADAVLRTTATEYGLDPSSIELDVACTPAATPCPAAGETVVVTVSARVRLPLVPAVLGLDRIASVEVEASAVQKVSRFWSAP